MQAAEKDEKQPEVVKLGSRIDMAIFGTVLLSMVLAAGTSVGALLFTDISWAGGIALYLVLSSLFTLAIASARMFAWTGDRRRDDGGRQIQVR